MLRASLLLVYVSTFLQEFSKSRLPVRELGSSHLPGKPDPVIFRDLVQDCDGCAVAEKDPLGIHSHRIVH